MSRWSHAFIGRESELQLIQSAWMKAKSGRPQAISIIAETGYGKTRLAQEFFNWLSTEEDGRGSEGYWPDKLLQIEDNLQPNPNLAECADDGRRMPFLWWGLRLTNPDKRNGIISTALRSGEEYLKAHLTAYTRTDKIEALKKQQHLSSSLNVADIAINLAQDFAKSIPPIGQIFSVLDLGKAILQTSVEFARRDEEIRELATHIAGAPQAAEGERRDLVDMIVADLRKVAFAPPGNLTKIPVVLFLDDMQWVDKDPAVYALVEKLLAEAHREQWPLLVLTTCWEREWHLGRHAGPNALFKLPSINHHPLFLQPLPDISALVQLAFPGLTPEQSVALNRRADGNPQFLVELLKRLDCSPRYFVDRDPRGQLTDEGLAAVEAETFESLVLHRLQAAPEHVQIALGLASLQGIKFSPKVVSATATRMAIAKADVGLVEGERPYSFTSSATENSSEFRASPYQEVAKGNLPNLADLTAAEKAMQDILLEEEGDNTGLKPHDEDVLEAKVALIDGVTVEARSTGFAALARLITMATQRYDVRTAGKLAELWCKRWFEVGDANSNDTDMYIVVGALRDVNNWADLKRIAESLHINALKRFSRSGSIEDEGYLVRSQLLIADATHQLNGAAAALPAYEAALPAVKRFDTVLGTSHSRYEYNVLTMRIADAIKDTQGLVASLPRYLESLPSHETAIADDDWMRFYIRRALGVLLDRIGDAYCAAADYQAAEQSYNRSLEIHRALTEENGDNYNHRDLAIVEKKCGKLLVDAGNVTAGIKLHKSSKQKFHSLWLRLKTPSAAVDYDIQLQCLANVQSLLDDKSDSIATCMELVEFRKATQTQNLSPTTVANVVATMVQAGEYLTNCGHYEKARDLHCEGLALALKNLPDQASLQELAQVVRIEAKIHFLNKVTEFRFQNFWTIPQVERAFTILFNAGYFEDIYTNPEAFMKMLLWGDLPDIREIVSPDNNLYPDPI